MDILTAAAKVIYNTDPERDRVYGPFGENMEKCAKIASVLTGKELSAEDCFNVMIAQKLVRETYCHKEDNLLDACGYIAGLNNYKNEKETDSPANKQTINRAADNKDQAA